MTHYEELGVSASATDEDIRQAHRRLVKLLHPDQQQDPGIRLLAERQMTRINTLVGQLLDPAQRSSYDRSLRFAKQPATALGQVRESWKLAVFAAGVIGAFALFSLSPSPTDAVRSAGAPGNQPPVTASQAKPAQSDAVPSNRNATGRTDRPSKQAGESPGPAVPVPTTSGPAGGRADLPPLAAPVPETKFVPESTAPEEAPLQGIWLYAGGAPSERDRGLYKPEYIELRITQRGGILHGDYRGRYAVTDKAISPAVGFTFDGKVAASSFAWKGPRGSAGTVSLKLFSTTAMQVDWKVTNYGDGSLGLGFGTATLVRRQ